MPQQSYYYPTPSENFDKLQDLLRSLIDFGFLHEEKLNEIEYLLCAIYRDLVRQSYIDEGFSPETAENSCTTAIEIYELIDDADKEQFIQDYRNAIAAILESNDYSRHLDELAQQVIESRDMELYKASIYRR